MVHVRYHAYKMAFEKFTCVPSSRYKWPQRRSFLFRQAFKPNEKPCFEGTDQQP